MAGPSSTRPGDLGDAFRRRVAAALAPHDFVARAKMTALVRTRGSVTDRIAFSSSHYNTREHVTCAVSLTYVDDAVRACEPGWQAGGAIVGPAFAEEVPRNVADPDQAEALFARVLAGLSFFDALDDAPAIFEAVCRRYVPGIVDPRIVVPYLVARLGPGSARDYARALLAGRPELWPAFAASREGAVLRGAAMPDHGTELAHALVKHDITFDDETPVDAVRSEALDAANLRCFYGRQLRAWGEPKAAAALRSVEDTRLKGVAAEREKLSGPLVTSRDAAELVLFAATGERRAPRRSAPIPRLFQYHALHEPFASA